MKTIHALLWEIMETGSGNLEHASEYAEPGYTHKGKGILFANWNPKTFDHKDERKHPDNFMPRLAEAAEAAGYDIEWSDEWTTCQDCGKAVRTSADSYSWKPSYAIVNECELLCHECIAEDPTDYLETIVGDDNRCLSIDLDLTKQGYVHIDKELVAGWHPGQNDDPKEIGKMLRSNEIHDYIWSHDWSGQFDIGFSLWVHGDENVKKAKCLLSGKDPYDYVEEEKSA